MSTRDSKILGMLGGGQLGRFFVVAAQKLGYRVFVLDPDKKSPAGLVADQHICKNFDDYDALDNIIENCFAVTTEFENIPSTTLAYLEKSITVHPSSFAVSIAQNRIKEKNFLQDNNFPVGPFKVIEKKDHIDQVPHNFFPAILKVAQFGYDGKGQKMVTNIEELNQAFVQLNFVPCVLEKKLSLDIEISVVMGRSLNSNSVCLPLAENQHKNGILDITISPARVSENIASKAREYAQAIAEKLDYVGVLAVEFFIVDNTLYINEIAPRPHNSGHYSLDACNLNQFDLQVRTLTDLELLDPEPHTKSVMVNLLGDIWFANNDKLREPNFNILLNEANVRLHFYGKEEPRRGRKMAHFNVLGDDLNNILDKAKKLKKLLMN